VNKGSLDNQISLLNLRKDATRLAIYLFENVRNQDELLIVSELLEQCNISSDKKVIAAAFSQMKQFGKEIGILKDEP
jgi:uncharacterized protein YfeS